MIEFAALDGENNKRIPGTGILQDRFPKNRRRSPDASGKCRSGRVRVRAPLCRRQQVFGPEFIPLALFARKRVFERNSRSDNPLSSPSRPSMAPQHSLGYVLSACRTIASQGFCSIFNHSKIVRSGICRRHRRESSQPRRSRRARSIPLLFDARQSRSLQPKRPPAVLLRAPAGEPCRKHLRSSTQIVVVGEIRIVNAGLDGARHVLSAFDAMQEESRAELKYISRFGSSCSQPPRDACECPAGPKRRDESESPARRSAQ